MRILFTALALAAREPCVLAGARAEPAADAAATGFAAFLESLRPRAMAAGVSRATLDATLPTLTFNPRVVRARSRAAGRQSGGRGDAGDRAVRALSHRAMSMPTGSAAGARAIAICARASPRSSARTGVPESIMLAIYGHETGYGTYTGDFDLLRSLASLAYEGRRRELFTGEFIATLLLIERGFPRSQMKGSWAGATGYPQFLPSDVSAPRRRWRRRRQGRHLAQRGRCARLDRQLSGQCRLAAERAVGRGGARAGRARPRGDPRRGSSRRAARACSIATAAG